MGAKPPFHFGAHIGHTDRNMRCNDHQLIGRLAIGKFGLQPGPARFVKKAVAMDINGAVVLPLRVVQHDDLERHIRSGHKTVTGKAGSFA